MVLCDKKKKKVRKGKGGWEGRCSASVSFLSGVVSLTYLFTSHEADNILGTEDETTEMCFRGSKEPQFFMSQHRKSWLRGNVIDKWFIRTGCLWGLQADRQEGAGLRTYWPTVSYSKEMWGGGEDHLLPHSLVDIKLPSSAPPSPPLYQVGEFSHLCVFKLGLSLYSENEQKDGNEHHKW